MEVINLRYMHAIQRSKIIALVLLIFTGYLARGQYNAYSFDQKYATRWLHFGIPMGYSSNNFRIKLNKKFIYNDSIRSVISKGSPGFHVGIITNAHLSKNLDFRFIPGLSFSGKTLEYETFYDTTITKYIESVNLEIPFLLKFKSDPYKDMRVYVLMGMKYTYDLASNVDARNAEDLVKIGRHDLLAEYGFGIEFYTPYVILAPEIKISQGLINVHARDPKLQFSNVLNFLFTRVISITLHIEG